MMRVGERERGRGAKRETGEEREREREGGGGEYNISRECGQERIFKLRIYNILGVGSTQLTCSIQNKLDLI